MKKGFISFLVVFAFVIAVTIAVASYTVSRDAEYWKPLSVDTVYYKMQDIKHAHYLAVVHGVDEGITVYNVKWSFCYTKCKVEECLQSGGTSCTVETVLSRITGTGIDKCKLECDKRVKFKDTVMEVVNTHLNMLSEDDFNDGGRFVIERWYKCVSDDEMDSMASSIRRRASSSSWADDASDYIQFNIRQTDQKVVARFEGAHSLPGSLRKCVIGFTVYDKYSNVSLVGYIPNTESYVSDVPVISRGSDIHRISSVIGFTDVMGGH